jgi:hypothetical protein
MFLGTVRTGDLLADWGRDQDALPPLSRQSVPTYSVNSGVLVAYGGWQVVEQLPISH